jgi:hypothetical protein
MTDDQFLDLICHPDDIPLDRFFLYRDAAADADIVGCWEDRGLWSHQPHYVDLHGPEYTALRNFLRQRGNPIFKSVPGVYDHACMVGWPNADKWHPV